jgi:uncharacterized protein YecE (DUF72 family)
MNMRNLLRVVFHKRIRELLLYSELAMMTPSPSKAAVYIGPSGWSYPDWNGIVYPARKGSRFDALAYLSRYFNAIEVNSSFYHPPTARTTETWLRRIDSSHEFLFTFKLYQRFTHQRGEYARADVAEFKLGISPIAKAGRLGCLLMQFPWSFRCTAPAFQWLARLSEEFGEYPLVAEVRHTSWDRPEVRQSLRDMRINYCNIDQPQLYQCLPPASHTTGPIGYVRLHGRRAETWFAENIETHERYNYLYSPEELQEWIPRIGDIAEHTDKVFVFTNNCSDGKSVANGLQLRALLEERRVDVPPTAIEHFPELREIAAPPRHEPPCGERTLFDL